MRTSDRPLYFDGILSFSNIILGLYTARNATKLCHVFGRATDSKIVVQNLRDLAPKRGSKLSIYG